MSARNDDSLISFSVMVWEDQGFLTREKFIPGWLLASNILIVHAILLSLGFRFVIRFQVLSKAVVVPKPMLIMERVFCFSSLVFQGSSRGYSKSPSNACPVPPNMPIT